jgi:hypothetical protein
MSCDDKPSTALTIAEQIEVAVRRAEEAEREGRELLQRYAELYGQPEPEDG